MSFETIIQQFLGDIKNIDDPLYSSMLENERKSFLMEFQDNLKQIQWCDSNQLFLITDEISDLTLQKMAYLNNKGVLCLSSVLNSNLKMFRKYIIHPLFFKKIQEIDDIEYLDLQTLDEIILQISAGRLPNFQEVNNIERYYFEELIACIQLGFMEEDRIMQLFVSTMPSLNINEHNEILRIIDYELNEEGEEKNNCKCESRNSSATRVKKISRNKRRNTSNCHLSSNACHNKSSDEKGGKNLKISKSGELMLNETMEKRTLKYRQKVSAVEMKLEFAPLKEYYDIHELAQNLNTALNTDFCSLTLFFPLFPKLVLKYKKEPFALFEAILNELKNKSPVFYSIINSSEKKEDQIIRPPTITEIHMAFIEMGHPPPNYVLVTKNKLVQVNNQSPITVLIYNRHVELYVGQPILKLPVDECELQLYLNNITQFRKEYKGIYVNV